MDQESLELDEDLRLAIRLSEIESQYATQSERKSVQEDKDYEYALKLSEELNSTSTSSAESTTFSSKIAQPKYDSKLTVISNGKCNNSEDKIQSSQSADASGFDFPSDVVDEDYLLAVKLAEKGLSSPSREVKEIESKDKYSNNMVDSDYELALRLAAQESPISLKGSDSGIRMTNQEHFESKFDTAQDFLSAQLFAMDDSDVEIVDDRSVDTSREQQSRNKRKNASSSTNSNTYMDKTMSVVDPSWETIDPNPDIYALFIAFNKRFFWNRLDMVEVKWSPRMTLCAGICSYHKRAGHCVVKLSKPLLSYRPRKDLVETLLHEMIHAYLFVTNNDRDRDGHGVHFHQHMYRINKDSGANITVYHSFHDEVRMYKTHVWKCDGPCQQRKPFYGFVRRSMNRAPGPNDLWWADHSASCGGKFHKISEPANYGKKRNKNGIKSESGKKPDITKFISSTASVSRSLFGTGSSSSHTPISRPTESASSSMSTNMSTSGLVEQTAGKLNERNSLNHLFTDSTTNSTNSFSASSESTNRNPISVSARAKIVTLADLSRNMNKKRSPMKSPSKSPKKWAPLPGQKNILSFIHKS